MAIVRTFRARQGAHLSHEKAKEAGAFLFATFGTLGAPARAVVDAARPDGSPIHDLFEWRDDVAAEQFRLSQARRLLRAIEVVHVEKGREALTMPAFEHVVLIDEEGATSTYLSSEVVWSSPDLRQQVIERARRELKATARRFREYAKLDAVFGELADGIEEQLRLIFEEDEVEA